MNYIDEYVEIQSAIDSDGNIYIGGPICSNKPMEFCDCPNCGGKEAVITKRHPKDREPYDLLICCDCGHEEER